LKSFALKDKARGNRGCGSEALTVRRNLLLFFQNNAFLNIFEFKFLNKTISLWVFSFIIC